MMAPLVGLACGENAPHTGKPALSADDTASAPRVVRGEAPVDESAPQSVATPGIEQAHALNAFFEALAELDEGDRSEDVRVVQFGDSHTAADFETGVIRRVLQSRFGDGGRGFVAIGAPWKFYVQDGIVRCALSRGFAGERARWLGQVESEARHGLIGFSIVARRAGAHAFTDFTVRASQIEVAYLGQPRGGSFEVSIDGQAAATISTKQKTVGSAYRAFDVTEGPHRVEVRAKGDGEVRLFGMALDRAARGLVYDAYGINGARATIALAWNAAHLEEQLRRRNPRLVVLAYGTNESTDKTPPSTYEGQLTEVIGRMRRAAPDASCLLLGPPDRAIAVEGAWVTAPKIVEIIQSQRHVAERLGCAFFSQLDAMGGEGAMAAWATEDPPLAAKDRVHMSKAGYAKLGNAFASALVRAYAEWRASRGLPELNGLPPGAVPPDGPPPARPQPPGPDQSDPNEPVARTVSPAVAAADDAHEAQGAGLRGGWEAEPGTLRSSPSAP
jgi:lysophospholipase L1-like esterase